MQDYKKLKVWAKAHALVLNVNRVIKPFPRDYGLLSELDWETLTRDTQEVRRMLTGLMKKVMLGSDLSRRSSTRD